MPFWHDHIIELCQGNQKDTTVSCPYRNLAGRVGHVPVKVFEFYPLPGTHGCHKKTAISDGLIFWQGG